jgi:ribosomal protein L40E
VRPQLEAPDVRCPRCQQENPIHARFCLGCRAHLTLACGSCGAELPGGARFCLQCGQAVAAGTAAPVRSPAPETYTPKHLAERIITSKAALEGERKHEFTHSHRLQGWLVLESASVSLPGRVRAGGRAGHRQPRGAAR